MLRVWWLSCVVVLASVVGMTTISVAQEKAKDPKAAGVKKEEGKKEEPKEETAQDALKKMVQELQGNFPAGVPEFEKQAAAFEKKYADDPIRWQLKFLQVQILKATGDKVGGGGKSSEELLNEVAAAKDAPEQMVAAAKSMLKSIAVRKELMSKPLELSFKAVDGREVDFAKMRGKVVLVDFWATWCGPCMAEVPNVVAAYKKLNDKGFEIVGISLDDDEEKLKKVVADKEMSWAHHFDGKGWKNEIAAKYGINSIPEMWLVNKKGMVKIYSRSDDLAGEVEKLLAE